MNTATRDEVGMESDTGVLWRAVLDRDQRYDRFFVYGVSSTGIYCRPSCPSRRPAFRNVVLFSAPEAARDAGYRSCLRCHPDEAVRDEEGLELVRAACGFIDDSPDELPNLETLSSRLGVSVGRVYRVFKKILGITPKQYADARRVERVKARLRDGDDVTTAMYDAGYGSSSRLYEQAYAHFGMTPAAYRKGGEGTSIVYTIVDSSLGRLLVGATEKGVSRISIDDDDEALEAMLRDEYPRATLTRSDDALKDWVETVLSRLEGAPSTNGDVPLDIQGTAFQRRVWEALRTIPRGETRSYLQVAEDIGNSKAVRAVANACATNPLPIVIPCHRVVRSDGTLGGYRFGTERKAALLSREKTGHGNEEL